MSCLIPQVPLVRFMLKTRFSASVMAPPAANIKLSPAEMFSRTIVREFRFKADPPATDESVMPVTIPLYSEPRVPSNRCVLPSSVNQFELSFRYLLKSGESAVLKYKSCAANAEFQKNADADKTAANCNNLLQFSILRGG